MHQGGFYLLPFAVGAALAARRRACSASARCCRRSCSSPRSAVVLGALRPVARRHRRLPPPIRTGAAALVGKRAMVLERIANDEGVGCVRIEGGEVWTARSYDEDEVIEAGERVEVVEITRRHGARHALSRTPASGYALRSSQ